MARDPLQTRLCEEYGCEYPIIAFAHTRDVTVAVSNAGGIGMLGQSTVSAEEMRTNIRWVKERVGDRPLRRRHHHPLLLRRGLARGARAADPAGPLGLHRPADRGEPDPGAEDAAAVGQHAAARAGGDTRQARDHDGGADPDLRLRPWQPRLRAGRDARGGREGLGPDRPREAGRARARRRARPDHRAGAGLRGPHRPHGHVLARARGHRAGEGLRHSDRRRGRDHDRRAHRGRARPRGGRRLDGHDLAGDARVRDEAVAEAAAAARGEPGRVGLDRDGRQAQPRCPQQVLRGVGGRGLARAAADAAAGHRRWQAAAGGGRLGPRGLGGPRRRRAGRRLRQGDQARAAGGVRPSWRRLTTPSSGWDTPPRERSDERTSRREGPDTWRTS